MKPGQIARQNATGLALICHLEDSIHRIRLAGHRVHGRILGLLARESYTTKGALLACTARRSPYRRWLADDGGLATKEFTAGRWKRIPP